MTKEPILKNNKTPRQIIWSMATYSGASIIGPLLLLGGVGYYLDRVLDKSPLLLLIGIGLAFVLTNILLFRRLKQVTDLFNEQDDAQKEEDK